MVTRLCMRFSWETCVFISCFKRKKLKYQGWGKKLLNLEEKVEFSFITKQKMFHWIQILKIFQNLNWILWYPYKSKFHFFFQFKSFLPPSSIKVFFLLESRKETHVVHRKSIHNLTIVSWYCWKSPKKSSSQIFSLPFDIILLMNMSQNTPNKLRKIDCDLDFFTQTEVMICPINPS